MLKYAIIQKKQKLLEVGTCKNTVIFFYLKKYNFFIFQLKLGEFLLLPENFLYSFFLGYFREKSILLLTSNFLFVATIYADSLLNDSLVFLKPTRRCTKFKLEYFHGLFWKQFWLIFKKIDFLFLNPSFLKDIFKKAFAQLNFFGSYNLVLKKLFFFIFFHRNDIAFLRLELKNVGESFGLRLLKKIELRKVHLIRFKNYFKKLILNTGLVLVELTASKYFGLKKIRSILKFLWFVNFYKKKFRIWKPQNLRKGRSLFFSLYLFCLFLKKKRNKKAKKMSSFIYKLILQLRVWHPTKRGRLLNFYWNYANRWPIEFFLCKQLLINKELRFINSFIFLTCCQSQSVARLFFIDFFKLIVAISRNLFNLRKWQSKLVVFKNFFKYWKLTFVRLFKFNRYFLWVLSSLKLDVNKKGLNRLLIFSQGPFLNYHFFSSFYKKSFISFKKALFWLLTTQTILRSSRMKVFFKKEFYFLILFIRFFIKPKYAGYSNNDILIELYQRSSLWLVQCRRWFDLLADYTGFHWYKDINLRIYKRSGIKKFNLNNRWFLWRAFKRTVLRFENDQRFKFFYKNNLALVRYFSFFYNYKFALLKKKTFRSFVSLLECKLDVLFFRAGFTPDILVAKFYIKQNKVLVDDTQINFLSFFVKPSSTIRAVETLWGKLLWRKNFMYKLKLPFVLNYIEYSRRLFGIFLIRKPFIDELIIKIKIKIPNKRYLKWLFWLA
jgi:ribosomal protein S4